MIKIERISLSSDVTFENVKLLSNEEQKAHGIPSWFEDQQVAFKCKDGTYTLPTYQIVMLLLDSSRTRLPEKYSKKVKRLAISGANVFENAYVLNPGLSEEIGLPIVFKNYEQFVFADHSGLYLTSDFQVMGIEL